MVLGSLLMAGHVRFFTLIHPQLPSTEALGGESLEFRELRRDL